MSRLQRLLQLILSGTADQNIPFSGLCSLLTRLGLSKRTKGSHHIFIADNIEEIINLQPDGSKAKCYQVKQVRAIIIKYRMGGKL